MTERDIYERVLKLSREITSELVLGLNARPQELRLEELALAQELQGKCSMHEVL